MPITRWQKAIFAFITVFFTVHLFVFYNLSYVGGYTLAQLESYGIPVFGRPVSIAAVILIEFICAYVLELLIGSPCSARLALRAVPPRENKPFVVETAIISATVCIMCPLMSLIAVFLYHDLGSMNLFGFLSAWLHTVMHNFPLAYFSQLFFIQPLVRLLYGLLARCWTPVPAPAKVHPATE